MGKPSQLDRQIASPSAWGKCLSFVVEARMSLMGHVSQILLPHCPGQAGPQQKVWQRTRKVTREAKGH